MDKSVKKKRSGYSTERVAVQLYCNLLRDFRHSEAGLPFCPGFEHTLMKSVAEFRAIPTRELGASSIGRFKRHKQMENLLKKFRFEHDAFTDAELSQKSFDKFLSEQLRFHEPMPVKYTGIMVMQRARLIARRILGEYPGDEVLENVQFGRKSSIGCPLSLAYIDNKLSCKAAMTGTSATTTFFLDQVLPGDSILQKILTSYDFSSLKEQLNLTHLNLVEVPKTWKAYRLITPLTLLGLFYSYGVGRVVQSRLKDAGLDIQKLQGVHRRLVKKLSSSLTGATADLSSASDSLTSELLNRVLPRAWYKALRKTFVRTLNRDGTSYSTASVLPMGNGATFPVETLVFYCLLKAIAELSGTNGLVSVYGDDLIYPSRMHKYVTAVFPQLHLKLNLDKTFVSYPFRESCGSDYYRGQDVRSYYLKGEAQHLTRVRYEAFLYKVYNGLTARWDPHEIRETLTWLLSELTIVSHGILRVPPSFPDYSGIKVSQWSDLPLSYTFLPWAQIRALFKHGSRWFQFDFLTETNKKRVVRLVEPYYWLALQSRSDENPDFFRIAPYVEPCFNARQHYSCQRVFPLGKHPFLNGWLVSSVPQGIHSPPEKPDTMLAWRALKPRIYFKHGKKVQERTKYQAVASSRTGLAVSTATTSTGSISDWI